MWFEAFEHSPALGCIAGIYEYPMKSFAPSLYSLPVGCAVQVTFSNK